MWCAAFAAALLALTFAPARAAAEAPPDQTVCLQPLGKHDKSLLEVTARGIEYLYGLKTVVLERIELPAEAYYKPRGRYRAEKLLTHLDAVVVPQQSCMVVIGFTAVDISTTKDAIKDWGVLGLATVGGPSGVVSTFRVRRKADWEKQAQRIVKVANHELGHALGLDHINEPQCLMEDAGGTIATVDSEPGLLCATERRLLLEKRAFSPPEHQAFDWKHVFGR